MTEYGWRIPGTTTDRWHGNGDLASARRWAWEMDYILIARDVSDPRVVSVRA